MGLGRFGGGAAAVRYASRLGARVTLTDLAAEKSLRAPLSGLADVPLERLRLGGHDPRDFESAEVVIVNPAVSPENPFLDIARESGAVLTSEPELFLDACPCPVIGVSGTNGKSTTSAMTAHVLDACGRTAWLGGNIGRSLLDDLDRIRPEDWVVLEISSFQLAQLGPPRARLALLALTNFSANHLDRHGTLAEYAAAKRRLFDFAEPGAAVVMNPCDSALDAWLRPDENAGLKIEPPVDTRVLPLLRIPGAHNRENAAVAVTLARLTGCEPSRSIDVVSTFQGLDHRLSPVRFKVNRRCFDDSASTTPQSTIAAMTAIPGPFWLLVGGKNKSMDLEPLIRAIRQTARGTAFFGSVAPEARQRLLAQDPRYSCVAVETLREACEWVLLHSCEGDAILFSPGFASTDQFANYVERSDSFRALLREYEGTACPPYGAE